MSETAIIGLFTAGFALLTLIFNGIMTYLMARLNTKAKDAADKVEVATVKIAEVAQKAEIAAIKVDDVKASLRDNTDTTNRKLDRMEKVGVATHTLVNSNMGAQLKISAVALRRVANLMRGQPGHEDDESAAVLAEKNLSDHVNKQAIVDGHE